MKKYLRAIVSVLLVLAFVVGCGNEKIDENLPDNERFKVEYESKNGKKDDHLMKMRSVSIPSDNPIIYVSCADVVNMVKDGKTFWLYCGFAKCPWCRGNIEAMLQAADDCDVDCIYYLDVYTCRDVYELKDGEPVLKTEGDDDYMKLVELFEPVLDDYTLYDKNEEKIKVGEKRIYAPNVILINDGLAEKLTTGSDAFEDSYGEISEELFEKQKSEFVSFFSTN